MQTGLHKNALNSHWPNLVVPLANLYRRLHPVRMVRRTVFLKYEDQHLDGVTVKPFFLCLKKALSGPVPALASQHLEFSGQRFVVVAYSLQDMQHALASDINRLRSLGFQVPESEQPLPSVLTVLRSTGAPSKPVFIEVFAGSAGITNAACDSGFTAIAVDWSRTKHESRAAPLNIDLSSEKGERCSSQCWRRKSRRPALRKKHWRASAHCLLILTRSAIFQTTTESGAYLGTATAVWPGPSQS